ncbi:MAG: PBSX family phage terminase large subunit [Pseudomonadales bacterium]|nr:PBSX family phage terminase large subunit [Pseudomonadales bacterium]
MSTAARRGPEVHFDVPGWWPEVFQGDARYRGAYGGRGSGKTMTFGQTAIMEALRLPLRFFCAREIQTSIRQSVHAELAAIIRDKGLEGTFRITDHRIANRHNGAEFIFGGLRHDPEGLKGLARADRAWIEEAEAVSEHSWQVLPATIRRPGSEIWLTWNPVSPDSATHQRFVKHPPSRACIRKVNFDENPWFPAELEQERLDDLRRDPDLYAHIWEGEFRTRSDAQVLAGKVRVEEFTPGAHWDGPYHGLDFGFAQDPTAGVRCWIADRRLWIEHEAVSVGLELDATAAFLAEHIPGIEDHVIRADSARPESISYLKRHGLPRVVAARKGPRSVEEGIAFLRSFDEIVVHPRCRETSREARLYSYKVDRVTGDVLPTLVDAHNHCIDAVRYAVEPAKRAQAQPRIRAL